MRGSKADSGSEVSTTRLEHLSRHCSACLSSVVMSRSPLLYFLLFFSYILSVNPPQLATGRSVSYRQCQSVFISFQVFEFFEMTIPEVVSKGVGQSEVVYLSEGRLARSAGHI
jgi:hypothetical protein